MSRRQFLTVGRNRQFNPNLSSGFVKLRAYARQIASLPAEGVAGCGEAGRKDR